MCPYVQSAALTGNLFHLFSQQYLLLQNNICSWQQKHSDSSINRHCKHWDEVRERSWSGLNKRPVEYLIAQDIMCLLNEYLSCGAFITGKTLMIIFPWLNKLAEDKSNF